MKSEAFWEGLLVFRIPGGSEEGTGKSREKKIERNLSFDHIISSNWAWKLTFTVLKRVVCILANRRLPERGGI